MRVRSFLVLVSLASGCVVVNGNGDVVTESRGITGITAVRNTSAFPVEVVVDAEDVEGVDVTCDSNLLEYLETEVSGGRLTVQTPPNTALNNHAPCVVEVFTTRFTDATNTGSGRFEASGALTEISRAEVTGSGRMELSDIATASINLRDSGSGRLFAAGVAGYADVLNTGSGGIDAPDLVAEDVVVRNTGSGGVLVHATESVDVTLTGSGGITVYGDPGQIDQDDTGSGNIRFE